MPQFANDALECANMFSGMEVIGLTDFGIVCPSLWKCVDPYIDRAVPFKADFISACGQDDRSLPAIMRWFVIEEYCLVHGITEPICQIDWEVMVFGNLEEHFNKCSVSIGDIGDTVDRNVEAPHNRTAPYYIRDHSAIRFFTRFLEAQVQCRTPLFIQHKCGGDMNWWEHVRAEGGYTPVNLAGEVDNAVFDLNIILDQDLYEFDLGKKVYWKDGKPYFKRLSDGGLVKAVALHCFWWWKVKTSDILNKAITGYSDV